MYQSVANDLYEHIDGLQSTCFNPNGKKKEITPKAEPNIL
jgi:hypothetical protein